MAELGQMRAADAWFLVLLSMATIGAGGSSPQEPADRALRGACYCRAAGQLSCLEGLLQKECNKQCAEALCDEWFWLERRQCWNWGYGG
jgi:hypothetical protein